MRSPIAVTLSPFNLDEVQPRIDKVREAFNSYLDYYVPKSSRSKHGLMGPVGKILGELKRGRTDPDYLKGYTLRVHELSQKGVISSEAVKSLEAGIENLTLLLREVPTTLVDRLIDRLDYGLYFERRKKVLAWLDERNSEYKAWLQRSYSTLEVLNQRWGTQLNSWEQVRFAGPSSQTYKYASAPQRGDMNDFRDHLRKLGRPGNVEIETEEESA